jgi:hypothetical protein
VQQGRPSQSIAVGLRKPKFVGDKVGVGTNTFRVTTGTSIVGAECGDHRKNLRGRLHRLAIAGLIEPVHITVKLAR